MPLHRSTFAPYISVPSDYYNPSAEPEPDVWARVETEEPAVVPVTLAEEPFALPPLCSAKLLGNPGMDAPGPSGFAYPDGGYAGTVYPGAARPSYHAASYPGLDGSVSRLSAVSHQMLNAGHAEPQGIVGCPGTSQDLALPPPTT